jgi:hypothetical protein
MKQHGKVDLNQKSIVKFLRQWPGTTIHSTASLGGGFPDIILGIHGRTVPIEIKGAKGKLTPQQQAWHRAWTGTPVVIVRSLTDALKLLQNIEAAHRHGIVPAALPHTER